jgi:hypothetical protein
MALRRHPLSISLAEKIELESHLRRAAAMRIGLPLVRAAEQSAA